MPDPQPTSCRPGWRRPLAVLILAGTLGLPGCAQYATVLERRPHILPPPPGTGLLHAAEETIDRALQRDRDQPLAAMGAYLDAAEVASRQLARNPNDATARRDYDFAIARVFTAGRDGKLSMFSGETRHVPGAQGDWQIATRTSINRGVIPRDIQFIPADEITLRGTYVSHRATKEGIGAPLVAIAPDASATLQHDPFAQGRRIYYGVTAVARFEGRRCVITFEDPVCTEDIDFAGHRQPLAADFTASLAVMLARENPKKLELARLLNPGKYAGTARLARLEPYNPAKIPVLCVHGLMDSPATWAPLLNTLRADPAIRQRYQFWFFSYPSGYPYPYSAALLRERLDAINARYPDHKKIVMIGHSMGGVISRLMITDSGDQLWMKIFGKPPAEVPLTPESRELLTRALVFRHRPEIGRVIFVAAPHRGSDLATNWMGRIGSSLVRVPSTMLKVGLEAKDAITFDKTDLKLRGIPNSVDTLSPRNRFVKAINTIPITPGIPYHCIVGDRGRGDTPNSSDGVVPYWSSHLDAAKSELIVPSGHNAHQNPQAISEIKRLLLLNIPGKAQSS